jgi:hypothetical protein
MKTDEMNLETVSASQHRKYQTTARTRSHLFADMAFQTG